MGGFNDYFIVINRSRKLNSLNRDKIFRLVDFIKSARFLVDGKLPLIMHTKDQVIGLAENKTSGIVIKALLGRSAYLNSVILLVSETERKSGNNYFLKIQSIFSEQSVNRIVPTVTNQICLAYWFFIIWYIPYLLFFNYVLLNT